MTQADPTERCEAAKFHSPTPLVLHAIDLRDGTTAMVCGTCRDNLAVYWDLLDQHEGFPPWPERREYGNALRALAERGVRETDG